MEQVMEKKINYRELQAAAKKLNLPGNLKHHLLIEIIEARKQGNEQLVKRILENQKFERAKRRTEKLEAKEAAYKHLDIFQEKKYCHRQRKIKHEPSSLQGQSHKGRSNSVQDNYLRSLLALPQKSLRELLKQSQQESSNRSVPQIKEQQNTGGTHYYNQYMHQQPSQSSQQVYAGDPVDNNYFVKEPPGAKFRPHNSNLFSEHFCSKQHFLEGCGSRTYNVVENNLEYKSQDPRRSFQMRDILGVPDPPTVPSYDNQVGTSSSLVENGQYLGEMQNLHPANQEVVPFFPTFANPANNNVECWQYACNDQLANPQNQFMRRMPDSNFLDNGNSSYGIDQQILSTPNSDTMSANEPEFEHVLYPAHNDSFSEFKSNNNQISYPLIYSYLANDSQVNYYPNDENQLMADPEVNYEVQEYPMMTQITTNDPLYIPTERACTVNQDFLNDAHVNFRVVKHQEWNYGYLPNINYMNYAHSVSSHTYFHGN